MIKEVLLEDEMFRVSFDGHEDGKGKKSIRCQIIEVIGKDQKKRAPTLVDRLRFKAWIVSTIEDNSRIKVNDESTLNS